MSPCRPPSWAIPWRPDSGALDDEWAERDATYPPIRPEGRSPRRQPVTMCHPRRSLRVICYFTFIPWPASRRLAE